MAAETSNPPEDYEQGLRTERPVARNRADADKDMAWLIVVVMGLVWLNTFVVATAPILVGALAVWLVLGRRPLWGRVALTAGGTFALGFFWDGRFLNLLVLVVMMTASLCYLLTWILPRFSSSLTRPVRFSLWEMAGCVLAVAVLCGFLRVAPAFQRGRSEEMMFTLIVAAVISLNVVLGSLTVFFTGHVRNRVWKVSYLMVLLVMPLVESFAFFLRGAVLPAEVLLLHAVAALAYWAILFPLEAAGAFRVRDAVESR